MMILAIHDGLEIFLDGIVGKQLGSDGGVVEGIPLLETGASLGRDAIPIRLPIPSRTSLSNVKIKSE